LAVELTQPVLDCVNCADDKIKLIALERIYGFAKTLKEIVLINFNDIFANLLNHSSDEDCIFIVINVSHKKGTSTFR